MNKKFTSALRFENSEILYKKNIIISGIDASYQFLLWENIPQFCIVFLSSDIESYTDYELEQVVVNSVMVWDNVSIIHHSNRFTHCNYNFDFRAAKF